MIETPTSLPFNPDVLTPDAKETFNRLQTAIANTPEDASLYYQLGNFYSTVNQTALAEQSYRNTVERDPQFVEAWNNLGSVLMIQNRKPEALECYQKALEIQPGMQTTLNNLGNYYSSINDTTQAQDYYRNALQHDPNNVMTLSNLGSSYRQSNQLPEADACFYQVARLDPALALRMGITAQQQGHNTEAINWYEKILASYPNETNVYTNLGLVYLSQGNLGRALSLFEKATELDPGNAEAFNNRGLVYKEMNQIAMSAQCYQQAIQANPNLVEPYHNLARVLVEFGDAKKALEVFGAALQITPEDNALRVNQARTLPPVYSSKDEIMYWRNRYEMELGKMAETGLGNLQNPVQDIGAPNYYLSYHGLPNRKLQELYVSLFKDLPKYREVPKREKRKNPKIGFVSRHLYKDHTIGKLFLGLIDQLSREKFDVTVFGFWNLPTGLASPHNHIMLPQTNLPAARDIVAQQEMDILIYTDIGMDPMTFYLAQERLAPVQCVTFGHPDTTGISALDYFLSATGLETVESRKDYTEQVVELPALPFYYRPPQLSDKSRDRAYYNLTADMHVYYCPQSLFKVHPDFDAYLGDILRADPKGVLVFLASPRPEWVPILKRRFEATIPDVVNRILFLQSLTPEDFLHLSTLVDVTLDTLYFGAGNSVYELMAFGTPMVTQPTDLLRGRFTAACLQKMGISECIADSREAYVTTAVRLGTDTAFRQSIKARIQEANHVLYNNASAVTAVEDFLLKAYEHAQSGGKPAAFKL